MAFSKKPKLCQDAAATYQQFNGMAENLDSFKTDLELEHAPLYSEDTGFGVSFDSGNFEPPMSLLDGGSNVGQHDHPLIARGVAYVAQTTTLTSPGVTSVGVQLWSASGCLQSFTTLSAGVYFFPITGFSKVWGKATPWHGGLGPVRVVDPKVGELIAYDARVQPATPIGTGATGLVVKTFMLQTPDGVNEILYPYHTGFYLVAYGRRGDSPTTPPRVEPLRRRSFGKGPRRRGRVPYKSR